MGRSGLPDLPARGPERRPGWGRVLEALGLLLIGAVLLLPVTAGILGGLLGSTGAVYAVLVLALPALALGVKLRRTGRRMKAPSGLDVLPGAGARPFVLYLRSFGDDELLDPTARFGRLVTPRYEETICRGLATAGEVVAVGRPGERLPELGAARLYADDADWRDVVTALMREAALVFLVAGSSEGIRWELETVLGLRDRPPVVVFFPFLRSDPDGKRRKRRPLLLDVLLVNSPVMFTRRRRERMKEARDARYRSFLRLVDDGIAAGLPGSLGRDSLVLIPPGGEPRVLPTEATSWWHNLMLLRRGDLDVDFERTLEAAL